MSHPFPQDIYTDDQLAQWGVGNFVLHGRSPSTRQVQSMAYEVRALREQLKAAYTEIRKQVVASGMVFDRDVVNAAKALGGDS